MSFSDADLIARTVLRDDQNAFAELVRRYQSPVRAFLVKMARGDSHLADDLAQQTFIRAWGHIKNYRGEGRFSTWLFGIAYHQFLTEARRKKPLLLEDLQVTSETSEESSAPISDLRMDLGEAMKYLSANERAAVLLCCQNGLSHDEAAKVLHCPIGTVKTNVLRGKEKLREKLKAEYHKL